MTAASLLRAGVTASAIAYAAAGMVLLFLPREIASLAGWSISPFPLQLFGAALIGFGAMNWIARGTALGGIYGKGIVSANELNLTIGAFVLAPKVAQEGHGAWYWAITALYVIGACVFLILARSGGLPPRPPQ